GIQIQNGQHIEGVRLVTSFGTGTIRGVVQVANGTLSPTTHLFVQVIKVGEQTQVFRGGVEADARGHFLTEGLTAGDYDLRVSAYSQESRGRPPMSVKQVVTVNEGATTEVNLTLDLTPSPNQ